MSALLEHRPPPTDGIRRLGFDPPHWPSADWKKKQTQTAKIDKQQKMHQARFLRRSCVALFQCCNFDAGLGRVLVVEDHSSIAKQRI
ncbi:hypothetical protein evm_009579 [Chilo suppressalis]|nr:hypothetical protein evm_009579 [Chilo suppressalis]